MTAQYWRNKLKNKDRIDFPDKLCDAIAEITDDFSFAYMKEAFVATLLSLARKHEDDSDDEGDDNAVGGGDDDPLDKYEFWKEFKAQVKILRTEMGSGNDGSDAEATFGAFSGDASLYEETMPLLDAMGMQDGGQPQPCKAASSLVMEPKDSQPVWGSTANYVHCFPQQAGDYD